MQAWQFHFQVDPLPVLLAADQPEIRYFTARDLLGEEFFPVENLWELPAAQRLLRRQQADGSWKNPSARADRASEDYDQVESFRNLGILVEKSGFDRSHPAISRAAEYFFSKQSPHGDIRGIYGCQYTPNYTAAILELLIKAGFSSEQPVHRGLEWLLTMRQDDGGWAIPLRTHPGNLYLILVDMPPLEPVRSKPSSHLATGCVLRAFAAHPDYRSDERVQQAANWLAARFFKADHYPDRRAPEYWLRFSFPYWFTDLISALDSLAQLGYSPDQANVQHGLAWFIDNQQTDGGWKLKLLRNKDKSLPLWMHLNICRLFKKFYPNKKREFS